MTISYPLTFPIQRTANFSFAMTPTVAVTKSVFTGTQQVYDWGNTPWSAAFDAIARGRAEWSALAAFVAKMRGQFGTVLIGPRHAVRPAGTCNTTGVTVGTGGAAALARALPLAGLGASKTLLAGDFIQLGSGSTARLHMVTEDATANGSGNATVSIEPPLRAAYLAGAAVTLIEPKVVMRSDVNLATIGPPNGGTISVSFSFSEAL